MDIRCAVSTAHEKLEDVSAELMDAQRRFENASTSAQCAQEFKRRSHEAIAFELQAELAQTRHSLEHSMEVRLATLDVTTAAQASQQEEHLMSLELEMRRINSEVIQERKILEAWHSAQAERELHVCQTQE